MRQRDLARHQFDLAGLAKDGTLERVLKEFGLNNEDSLLAEVGYGKITSQQVLAKIVPEIELERRREQREGALARLMRLVSRPPKGAVRVSGLDGEVLVRFAKCCQPLPGERIAGFDRGFAGHQVQHLVNDHLGVGGAA